MDIKPTKSQYKDALSSKGVLKAGNLRLLTFLFFVPGCEATAQQITSALGHGNHAAPANSILGNLGKRIARYLGQELPAKENKSPGWWRFVATGEQQTEGFVWQLRPELADALIELDLIQEPTSSVFPELIETPDLFFEGAVKSVSINAYERNPAARDICVAHYGAQCAVCEFKFEAMYGSIGADFIHVHHLKELSSVGKKYQVDPVKHLRPVCPNCHAMLHKRNPAYSIKELREIIENNA